MNSVLLLILGVALAAAAIVAVALIVRKTILGPGRSPLFAPKSPKRIDIVEQATIDAKRKLLLVRRDNVEHLLMTGGPVRPLGQAAGER